MRYYARKIIAGIVRGAQEHRHIDQRPEDRPPRGEDHEARVIADRRRSNDENPFEAARVEGVSGAELDEQEDRDGRL